MGSNTHNILIFDNDNTIVLAGAYQKQLRHPGAKILAADDIAAAVKPIFDAQKDKTPWKLHIIQHGSIGMNTFGNKSMADVAALILKSGLADQPNQTTKDEDCPVVRLDVCEAGLDNPFVKSTLEQLASALRTELTKAKPKRKTRMVLWGGKGLVIPAWTGLRGERMIADSNKAGKVQDEWNKAKLGFQKLAGIEVAENLSAGLQAAKLKAPSAGRIHTQAEELLKSKLDQISEIEKKCPAGLNLQAKAEVAWTLYQEAMQMFHASVQAASSLTVEKKVRAGQIGNPKSSYLARAEVAC